jgi:thiosulfate/3-mercaptopyruvate sulfurtransferase
MTEYAQPEVLVSTDWVRANLDKPGIKIVEVDVDTRAYLAGHAPGAIGFNWQTQLQDQVRRDIVGLRAFEELVGNAGISRKDIVVLYGDHNNWFAAYGFWLFKLYGHADVRMMNGGRLKWINEEDKPLSTELPTVVPVEYRASAPHPAFRAMVPQVLDVSQRALRSLANLVDVRTSDEFLGKVIAPPGMSETAQRAGHIPGARCVPWNAAVNSDGTFKTPQELYQLYVEQKQLDPGKETITYCRIGERSSHTWFVLKYLLGFQDIKNYDGSWTEYGNLIGVPIEVGV